MHNCEANFSSVNISTDGWPNVSVKFRRNYLETLQFDKNLAIIPTFVYLVSLFLLGVIGNPLIILVYSREKKRTATRFFIVSIAAVDLMATLVTIPVTFYVNFRSRVMDNVYICKLYFFVNFTNATISAFLLLAVAFVRYRKICHPLAWQVSTRQARMINMAIALACISFSIPHVIVHGRQERSTEIPGLCIHLCYLDDGYMTTPWPKIVIGLFILIFMSDSGIMCYLYARIGQQARRHDRRLRSSLPQKKLNKAAGRKTSTKDEESSQVKCSLNTESANDQTNSTFVWQENITYEDARQAKCEVRTCAEFVEPAVKHQAESNLKSPHSVTSDRLQTRSIEPRSGQASGSEIKPRRRTTYMLLTITVVYVVTNMTTLALMFLRATAHEHVLSLGPVWAAVYSIFFNLFLLNCAVNPIIYSMWNRNFRKGCANIFRKIRRGRFYG